MKAIVVHKDQRKTMPMNHPGLTKDVIVENGMLPPLTQISVALYHEGQEVELHQHKTMWALYFILSGEGIYTIGDETVTLKEGSFLAIPPTMMHKHRCTVGPHKIYYMGLATD